MSTEASIATLAQVSAGAPGSTPWAAAGSTITILPLRDAASRMFVLARLIASFDEGDPTVLAQLLDGGCTPELLDRLRGMTMTDALRFTADHCGLALGLDSAALQRGLRNLERRRADRETYEYLVRAGASPVLLGRLFTVTATEVRRLRKIIAPGVMPVGRPRIPDEDTCAAIVRQWERICAEEPGERQRYLRLHKAFQGTHLVATLESALRDHHQRVAAVARSAAAHGLRASAESPSGASPLPLPHVAGSPRNGAGCTGTA
ncbi:MAG: DUF2857 family protein [Rubrivivax sp.]|nr:DUF2857 family protein [Rubrivivax sp.]